jgi:hypothetical protein
MGRYQMTFHLFFITILDLVDKLGPTITLVIIARQLHKLAMRKDKDENDA